MTAAIYIYTDGACSKNPGPGGWAFVACHPSSTLAGAEPVEVTEAGAAEAATTNNRMELRAAIEALKFCRGYPSEAKVFIFCDSKLVIQGATTWIHGWRRKNWLKADGQPVLNPELWKELGELVDAYGPRLEWVYVPGHSGIGGNDRVDEIAVDFSQLRAPLLYKGSLANYALHEIFSQTEIQNLLEGSSSAKSSKKSSTKKSKSSSGPGAYYLSFLNGELQRHNTWSECELRVKGKSGAKFKKVQNVSEESQVLKLWMP